MGDALRKSGCRWLLAGSLCLAALGTRAQTQPLNDTGQLTCYDYGSPVGTVSLATPDPQIPTQRGQDCTLGRSAADALGRLGKRGGSSVPGRDYSKIANDGSELPANAPRGSAPGDWGCTRDNVTGLTWENRTSDGGLRDITWTYAWFDADGSRNGGFAGSSGSDSCGGTLPACTTTGYRDAVNALPPGGRLCGATDWRLPSVQELLSLLVNDAGTDGVDTQWIQARLSSHWTAQTNVQQTGLAWCVSLFNRDIDANCLKAGLFSVILVRGAP